MRTAAMYVHDERGRILMQNQWDGGEAPRFYLGRTIEGVVVRFRDDVPDGLVQTLQRLSEAEPVTDELAREPSLANQYIELLTAHTPVKRLRRGPAFYFADEVETDSSALAIDEENADLLNNGLEVWIPDVPHRKPFMAMIEDGHAVSVCASVRITKQAHEAGVETLPAYRLQGHAVNVVAGWARAVRDMDAMPFYSTSWDNVASQKVSSSLSLSLVGVDFHVT